MCSDLSLPFCLLSETFRHSYWNILIARLPVRNEMNVVLLQHRKYTISGWTACIVSHVNGYVGGMTVISCHPLSHICFLNDVNATTGNSGLPHLAKGRGTVRQCCCKKRDNVHIFLSEGSNIVFTHPLSFSSIQTFLKVMCTSENDYCHLQE